MEATGGCGRGGGVDGVAHAASLVLPDQLQVAHRADTPVIDRGADLLDEIGDDLDQVCEFLPVALQILR